jgi:hypothetical protein
MSDVWENIVSYYYDNIQPTRDISIWEWIEYEYGGQRYHYLPNQQFYQYIRFTTEEDATAFKLKFLVEDGI